MTIAAVLAALLAGQPSGRMPDASALTGWPICVMGARRAFAAAHGQQEGNRLLDGFLARQRLSLLDFLRRSQPAPEPEPEPRPEPEPGRQRP